MPIVIEITGSMYAVRQLDLNQRDEWNEKYKNFRLQRANFCTGTFYKGSAITGIVY